MRVCFFISLLSAISPGPCAAQSALITTYQTDLNGNRIETDTKLSQAAPGTSSTTDLQRSINGREVPLLQTTETVLREDSSGSVRERIIKRYNENGQLASTERVLIEETKLSDGGSNVRTTAFASDINGNQVPTERKTIETRVSGNTTTSETLIERPSLNSGFDATEKHSAITEVSGDTKTERETVYRSSPNGGFYEALRQVTTETKSGNQVVDNTAVYEQDSTGGLSLSRQQVKTTTTNADGSSSSYIDVFGRAADGRAQANGAPPQLIERQTIEQQKGAGGSTVQSVIVQPANPSYPNQLGSPRKVSETVCRGECGPAAKQ